MMTIEVTPSIVKGLYSIYKLIKMTHIIDRYYLGYSYNVLWDLHDKMQDSERIPDNFVEKYGTNICNRILLLSLIMNLRLIYTYLNDIRIYY